MNSKKIIPISALMVFGTITFADIEGKGQLPTTREFFGMAVLFTFLSAGADMNIPIAGGFAVLIMVAVFLSRGLEALEFITGKLEGKEPNKLPPAAQFHPYYPPKKAVKPKAIQA